jgi:fibronectin type 3 domain-containing protein
LFVHVAAASDPASFSWTFGSSAAVGTIAAYDGVDADAPVDQSAGGTSSTAAITAPSLTLASTGDVLVGIFSIATGASFTPPASMAERGESSASGKTKVSLELADELISAAGGTGARTATADKAGAGIGQLVALRPAGQTPATTVPEAPRNLVATGGTGTVHLTWSTPASEGGSAITGYRLYRSTSAGAEVFLRSVGNVTSSDDAVAAGTYFYRVAAVNGVGEGPVSSEASATATDPVATVPGAPQALSASPASGRGVQLNWTAPASNGGTAIISYRIYRGTSTGSVTLLTTLGVVTSYKDSTTTRGATYFYVVAAVNAVGEGAQSAEVSSSAK